ncbi:hypothetical protein GDO81_027376 [Engystomops pustulosus]|uniref:G-protein coupled receptors family 1 profile domain-containing protein n=1 Tax=Engystomops pustulosus TaxID=76066 RepID=A0AAV6ZF25_ENGPU|nr:hypothetical protein GDO81_027376 [Engystomops pustulosus]
MENVTRIQPLNHTKTQHDHRLITFNIVVYSVVFSLGSIGNGLVIWFGMFRLKKTVNVVWFLNLAVTDFIFTLALPVRIKYYVIRQWTLGPFLCDLYWFLFFLNTTVSVLQLMVISLDRFLCVFSPVWCQNHRKPRRALLVALAIWIVSVTFCLSFLIAANKYEMKKNSCYHQADIYGKIRWMGILKFVVFFLLPFLVILSCYIAIYLRMRSKHLTSRSRPYKVILAIIGAFLICWVPYNVFSLLRTIEAEKIDKRKFRIIAVISNNLMIINSCINPLLYVFIGRDFKKKLCSLCQGLFEKVLNEDFENTSSRRPEASAGNRELSQITASLL